MYRFFESLIHPALDILHPRTIVEIGVDEGLHTRRLLTFCQERGATLHAVDPEPHCDIAQMQRTYGKQFVFHCDLSLNALYHIDSYDVVLIDGDHNWYTVYHELLLIEKKAGEQGYFPLVFLHDIGWPYGRRDLYYNPENIPAIYRQPYQKKGIDLHSHSLVQEGGLNRHLFHALYEHNIRSGVLTAIEDFIAQSKDKLDFQTFPGCSGLGIIASRTLLTEYPSLQEFLASVRISTPIAQHIATLEHEHLEYTVFTQQYRHQKDEDEKKFRQIEQELASVREGRDRLEGELASVREGRDRLEGELASVREGRDRLRTELTTRTGEILHLMQTRSWRWTAPLRIVESLVRRLSSSPAYTTLRLFRWLWTALGSPFPQAARHIRHDILGRYFPSRHPSPSPPLHLPLQERQRPQASSDDLRIATIILCHNQAVLLPQTLESLLTQTKKFSEILIVDDDSSDDTKNNALGYAGRGVEYLHDTWGNTCAAWNAGLKSTESSLLIFLHAGDILPPEYLHHCREAFGKHPEAAIVYADRTSHQPPEKHSVTPDPFDPERFERENYFPDCSAVRRTALLEVGEWNHGMGENATWITWRRIIANGWKAVKIPGTVTSSSPKPTTCHPERSRGVGEIHHASTTLSMTPPPPIDATLCLSLSGRAWMWPLTREFLEQQTYSHGQTHLIIIDTSQEQAFGNAVQEWLRHCDYGKHTYMPLAVGLKGLADLPRRVVKREVASACALIYNTFVPRCTTPWVFFLEDDVIPPLDVYPKLLQHIDDNVVSVSALCMQRISPHPIAWEWGHAGMPEKILEQREGVTLVGGNGFCCVALRGEYVREAIFHSGPFDFCHDHNFYRGIVCEQNLQALLDWSCVCRHYVSPGEWRTTQQVALTEHSPLPSMHRAPATLAVSSLLSPQ